MSPTWGGSAMGGWAALAGLAVAAAGCATPPPRVAPRSVEYTHLQRDKPRPLQIHVLRVDLQAPGVELDADIAPDPDGDGPAETALVLPLDHADKGGYEAGVNANAWSMTPPPPPGERPRYTVGGACDICGWALAGGAQRSPPQPAYGSFWLDARGSPCVGNVSTSAPAARLAVSGFAALLKDGAAAPRPSEVRHPRTALGVDRGRRYLVLAVVDGRQPGYSEGMSEREMADLMLELGCADALNLDGGGSTAMVLRDATGTLRIVNRPSDPAGARPVPVFLGVRQRRP